MTEIMVRIGFGTENEPREKEPPVPGSESDYWRNDVPVLSYLAWPAPGQKHALISILRSMPECEVIESDSDDLLILVTQTTGEEAERQLEKELEAVESLAMLTLVFGHRADSCAQKETQR